MTIAQTATTPGPLVNDLSGRRLLVAIIAWVTLSVSTGFLTAWIARAIAQAWGANPNNLAIVIVAEVYGLLVTALLVAFRQPSQRRIALAVVPVSLPTIGLGLLAWIAAYAVAFVGYGAAELVVSADPSIVEVLLGVGADAARLHGAGLLALALILLRVCVFVPLGEELLFRGALYEWLRRRLSMPVTVTITAVLWASIHQIPIMMPLAFIVGLAAGWVRETSGSVVPVIIAHGVQNAFLVALSWFVSGWTAPLPFGT